MKKQLLSLLAATAFVTGSAVAQQNDMELEEIILNKEVYASGDNATISFKFKNAGANNITSIDFNWSDDGGATVNTYNLSGFPFTPNNSLTLQHNTSITFANPGSFTNIKAWVSNPNGVTDSNNSNDTLVKQVFVNTGNTVAKNVFIEEFTTAPCGYCPDGAYVLENLLYTNPEMVAVGVHAGFGTDAMTIPEHSTLASAFATGAPTAAVDRVHFSGESTVGFSRGQWASRANSQKAKGSEVGITFSGNYNSQTRAVTVTVNYNFVDYVLPGRDYRVGLYVLEDSVTGTGSGYNQRNYPGNSGPYGSMPDPIVGYNHRHVLRQVFPAGNPWGESNVIVGNPTNTSTFSKTYTFTLNSSWNDAEVSLAAYVGTFGATSSDRAVLNSDKVKLGELTSTSISEDNSIENNLSVFPVPAANNVTLKLTLNSNTALNTQITDISGKVLIDNNHGIMSKGTQRVNFDVSDLANGIYFVRVNAGKKQMVRKISVVR